MRSAVLIVLCACNPVFGLSPTTEEPAIDAQYFDAAPDAPFACWAPHAPVPSFSTTLHQVVQSDQCSEYTIADGWATATCYDAGTHVSAIYDGVVDAPLTEVAAFAPTPQRSLQRPRQAPEGGLVFLKQVPSTGAPSIVGYRRTGQTWNPALTVTPTIGMFESFGTPSAGPIRRMMIVSGSVGVMREVAIDQSGTMTEVRVYDSTNFPFNGMPQPPNLSADGLRMIVYGGINNSYAMYVMDRETLDQPFQHRSLEIPTVYDAFMTNDCGRIYFADVLGALFFVQRR